MTRTDIMPILRTISLAAASFASPALYAADPAQVPEFHVPARIAEGHAGPWRPFRMQDLTFPRSDYNGFLDIDASLDGGKLILALEDRFTILQAKRRLDLRAAPRAVSGPIPASPMGAYYGGLKFRQGRFHVRSGTTILRQDPVTGAWSPCFKARRLFSQFEILPGGRILLVCPTDRPTVVDMPAIWTHEMVCSAGNERMPIAELYEASRPDRPVRTYPFPPAMAPACMQVNGFPLIDRTFQVNDHFFLINSQAGQVFVFDATNRSMAAPDTPWTRLDTSFLAWVDRQGLRPLKEAGETRISCHAFPLRMHTYPQDGRTVLFAVIQNSAIDAEYTQRMDALERKAGNRFAPLPRVFTPAERAAWTWMTYWIYDIQTQRFTRQEDPRLAGLRLDFTRHWLTSAGDAIPAAELGLGGGAATVGYTAD